MLFPTNQFIEETIAENAATIALHNFHMHYATLVLFNSTLLCSVNIFLQSYQNNVYIGHGTFYPRFYQKIRQYVVFGTDLPDIVQMLTWMKKHRLDNTGRYIVVCHSERWDNCNEDDLVKILWHYKIINVIVINNRNDKTVKRFTYYHPEDCKNPHPVNVENWNFCLLNGDENCMYPLKLKNLHRCPLIVSTFIQVPYMNISNGTPNGADGDLLRVIADAMNFSLVMMTPRIGYGWGKVEDNGTWTGSLADVYNDWANFSMTSASITLSRFSTFQMSMSYSVATIAWVTHPTKTQAASMKLLRPFQPYVQIALSVSFAMVVLLHVFLKSNLSLSLRHKLVDAAPYDVVFHSWTTCMGLPITSFPTSKVLSYLATSWMWYCLLIRTFYQTCLINSLKTDVYELEFDTIEEAIASSYTLGGGLALRDYFIENPLVYNRWKNVESVDIQPMLVKLSQGLKFVLAMNKETTKIFLSTNPDKKLHILRQVINSSPTPIFFKKYSPLEKPLNVVLSRLRESGIIQKLYNDNTGKKVQKEALDNIPISMTHYTGCYAILLTGWLLSSLCFIIETIMYRK